MKIEEDVKRMRR